MHAGSYGPEDRYENILIGDFRINNIFEHLFQAMKNIFQTDTCIIISLEKSCRKWLGKDIIIGEKEH